MQSMWYTQYVFISFVAIVEYILTNFFEPRARREEKISLTNATFTFRYFLCCKAALSNFWPRPDPAASLDCYVKALLGSSVLYICTCTDFSANAHNHSWQLGCPYMRNDSVHVREQKSPHMCTDASLVSPRSQIPGWNRHCICTCVEPCKMQQGNSTLKLM